MKRILYCGLTALALIGAALATFGTGSAAPTVSQRIFASIDSLASAVSGTYTRKRVAKAKKKKMKKVRKGSRKRYAKRKRTKKKQTQIARLQFKKGYRTVCVRLCDGFFFPVNGSAHPSRFHLDEAACQSQCGAPSKLFVYKNDGGSVDEMVDLDGNRYADIVTARKHRVSYDASCTCKPKPWSKVAQARHKMYALQDAVTELKTIPFKRIALLEPPPKSKRIQLAALKTSSMTDAQPASAKKATSKKRKAIKKWKKKKKKAWTKSKKRKAAAYRARKKNAKRRKWSKKAAKSRKAKKRVRKVAKPVRRRVAAVKRGLF